MVGSYDGSIMRLLVNGAEVMYSTAQTGMVRYPLGGTFAIGAYVDSPDVFPLRGALDDVALWDRALAADAVAAMDASQRTSAYFVCPLVCLPGTNGRPTVSTGECVGNLRQDCVESKTCPVCSVGKRMCA